MPYSCFFFFANLLIKLLLENVKDIFLNLYDIYMKHFPCILKPSNCASVLVSTLFSTFHFIVLLMLVALLPHGSAVFHYFTIHPKTKQHCLSNQKYQVKKNAKISTRGNRGKVENEKFANKWQNIVGKYNKYNTVTHLSIIYIFALE